ALKILEAAAPPDEVRKANVANFWRRANEESLEHLDMWVQPAFPTAEAQAGTGGYRVHPADVGRPDLQEDLSFHRKGIKDFGTHDLDEAGERQGRLTAIDALLKFSEYTVPKLKDAKAAAFWLCAQMNIDPVTLGWEGDSYTIEEMNEKHAVLPIGG